MYNHILNANIMTGENTIIPTLGDGPKICLS